MKFWKKLCARFWAAQHLLMRSRNWPGHQHRSAAELILNLCVKPGLCTGMNGRAARPCKGPGFAFLYLRHAAELIENAIYNFLPCVRIGHGGKLPLSIVSRCSTFFCGHKTFASTILLTRCRCAGCFPSRPADAWKTALLRILSLCSGSTDCQLCGNCSDSLERWGDLGRFIAYGNAEMVLRSQIRTRRN